MKRHAYPLILVALATLLIMPKLGAAPLWQDEAETALLARNILSSGLPLAFDGRNVITQNQGIEFGESYIWTWSPWLQFYTTATSFALLGESAMTARLPFALIGILSVAMLYRYVLSLTGSRRTALLAALLMTTSLPFLLHARQCRWYMPAVFSTIWLLWAWLQMCRNERAASFHFVAASGLLFHSNFLIAAYLLLGIFAHYAVSAATRRPRPALRSLLIGLGGFALVCGPWAIYAEIWSRPNTLEEIALPWAERIVAIAGKNLSHLNHELLPLPMALLLPWAWLGTRDHRVRSELTLLFSVVLCALALLSFMPWTYFRYLIGLLPVCCILVALVLDRLFAVHRALGIAVCLVAISSNAFCLAIAPRALRFDIASYWYTITSDPVGPNRGIVDYLGEHGGADDLVLTNYGQLPIIFHTGMRAVGFGQDLRVAEKPDWIIIRMGRGARAYLLARARGYREVRLESPDLRWGNRPDPTWYRERPLERAPRVILHQRTREDSADQSP